MSWRCPEIQPVASGMDAEIQDCLNQKTKPFGSLGRIEELAMQLARLQQSLTPKIEQPLHLVFAADHGVVAEGVSPFPQQVTAQMVNNFCQGGAAINVFCRQLGWQMRVINAGVAFPLAQEQHPMLVNQPVAPGTANLLRQAAMSSEQCLQALALGQSQVEQGLAQGSNCFSFGEMGIGNTTSSAAMIAALLGLSGEQVAGAGTGLSLDGQLHKAHVINQSLARFSERTALAVLRQVGGYEIAAMVGAMLAAAQADALVLVDGVIAQAAALCAIRLAPAAQERMLFAHAGREPGIQQVLHHLQAKALLDLNLALGEGSGAVLALPMLQCSAAMLREMASFSQAGVSDAS